MKLVLALFLLCVAVQMYEAAPSNKKETNCPRVCTAIYKPVCAYDPSDNNRERTFGSECVFKSHNCEPKNKKLIKKHEGECKLKNGQKGGVRLS